MDYASNAGQAVKEKASRINADVDRVLSLVKSVHEARARVQRHRHALGYDAPPVGEASGGKIQPISNTMQSAITDLDRAIAALHDELSLFD
jgi:hypothetical protein